MMAHYLQFPIPFSPRQLLKFLNFPTTPTISHLASFKKSHPRVQGNQPQGQPTWPPRSSKINGVIREGQSAAAHFAGPRSGDQKEQILVFLRKFLRPEEKGVWKLFWKFVKHNLIHWFWLTLVVCECLSENTSWCPIQSLQILIWIIPNQCQRIESSHLNHTSLLSESFDSNITHLKASQCVIGSSDVTGDSS